jgi:hypothetical protein
MAHGRSEGFLGGSPLSVIVKLALASLLVGFLLSYFDLTPWTLFVWAQSEISSLIRGGWRSLGNLGGYLLLGAMIVVPVWLLSRLLARRR